LLDSRRGLVVGWQGSVGASNALDRLKGLADFT
jgi:hypothetical protein